MKPPVFLTGATGFLGMEVLARLLEQGDREVLASCARADDAAAEARLDGVLAQALARPVAVPRARPRGRRRRHRAGLGIDATARAELAEEVGAVLHCAASISFDLPLDEARAINVEGTREMHRLRPRGAGARRLERFVHVSTAYVAGRHDGRVPRAPARRRPGVPQHLRADQVGGRARSSATASDLDARDRAPEHRHGRVATRAGRPRSTSSTGRCARSRAGCSRRSRRGPTAASTSCRSTTSPTRSCTCSTRREAGRRSTSSPAATRARSTSSPTLACAHFDRPRPPFVAAGASGTARHADEHGAVYLPYFDMDMVFDDTRARALLGAGRHPGPAAARLLPDG